jgi:small multidrug resistance pump
MDRKGILPMNKWILLGSAILSEVTGSLSMKAAVGHPAWYAVVFIGYATSFVLLDRVLRAGVPLGVAYGIWGALGVALTAGLSAALFGEALTGVMIVGIVLVIAGVACIELGHGAPAKQEGQS